MRRTSATANAIAWCILVGLSPVSASAAAKEKIAVLVLGASPADAELADNVTEVVIARIAGHGDLETVGTPEVRRRLASVGGAAGLACVDEADCLARVAVSLGARRGIIGSVTTRGRQFLLDLALADLDSGQEEARATRAVEAEVDRLVAATQEIIAALLTAPPEPAAVPERQIGGDRLRAPAADGSRNESKVLLTPAVLAIAGPPNRNIARRFSRYALYGSGVASLGALTIGLVFGGIAEQPIVNGPRVNAQKEFEDRRRLGLAADIALVSSAALAALSAYLFVRHRNETFGPDQPSE